MEEHKGNNLSKETEVVETSSSETNGHQDLITVKNPPSQNLFPESPVYDPEEDVEQDDITSTSEAAKDADVKSSLTKRKLVDNTEVSANKIQKMSQGLTISTQTLDNEVSEIISAAKYKLNDSPSTSRVRTPVRSSPRKITKRSNSSDVSNPETPRTPKTRSASVDITKAGKTLQKDEFKSLKEKPVVEEVIVLSSDTNSQTSIEFVKEISPPKVPEAIAEDSNSDLNDSQNIHLILSPTLDDETKNKSLDYKYSSDPVAVKDREEIVKPGFITKPHSEGYNYSDQSSNLTQPRPKDFRGKTTDQESTDSVGSIESPDNIATVTNKLISKLSNGNSSTPSETHGGKFSDSENTPEMMKLNALKGKKNKDCFRVSNNNTPSTISPLQNGHSLPVNTPQIPVFDVHVSHNEDGEFLSLYVVRTDNDLGMDMCKEYQRFSKRFTIDPYLGDVSVSNSPSSVTSGGMINLPHRTSFASTVSSTSTSSTRTSDGNFVVPQPPRKSVSNPSSSIKGYESLMKKMQDIFSHIRDFTVDEGNRSTSDEKISIGIQASGDSGMSNGNASPEEVGKCDKATPKSSLKKTRVRGRRPIAGKTKRAILPTQAEEPEYMHGMNSPEMVPMNGENGKSSPIKSPKEEKPNLVATPKSVSKLKQKRRPTSPRPATPVDKSMVKSEYPGFEPDTVVLAKWVDKRYYSGRVIEITEPNKYLIKFDDGQSKVLLDDFIIFGDLKTLPLQGQSVYAMVDEEQNYEPGLVLGVEENESGTVIYRCTTDGDTVVLVTASELYLTEDQARSLADAARRAPPAPPTPRRKHFRELDLDNIIQGPRSARSRDKAANSSARKRVISPKSPKASTSGLKTKSTPVSRKRLASESSEMSESSNSAPPVRLEEVAGVEPELQRTPRKIDGVKAGPLQLKGAAKQNVGKKNSKLTKFENDEDTVTQLGPIPEPNSKIFAGLNFLLTCTETPKKNKSEKVKTEGNYGKVRTEPNSGKGKTEGNSAKIKAEENSEKCQETRQYSSEEDGETTSTMVGTDTEDLEFSSRPFNKERLKEQLEAGGGTVYSHFDEVPKSKYGCTRLVAPRPCLTAKYILCVAADVRVVSHAWVLHSCERRAPQDADAYALPAGWDLRARRFLDWAPSGKRNTLFFKDKTILLCGDQDTFVKFWERVCTLAGANTRVVNEEDLNMSGALALVTEWDCPHEVQNKANQDNIPLVATTWVVQCLIAAKVIDPTSHDSFSFMYTEPE